LCAILVKLREAISRERDDHRHCAIFLKSGDHPARAGWSL
jgi:hypothetical protein